MRADTHIELKAECWCDDGVWRLRLGGPRWVLVELSRPLYNGGYLQLTGGPTLHCDYPKDQQESVLSFEPKSPGSEVEALRALRDEINERACRYRNQVDEMKQAVLVAIGEAPHGE